MVDIYGNKLHQNDGTHLDGGMADNYLWQWCWQRPAAQLSSWYATPLGDILTFMALLKEVLFIFDIHIQKSEVFQKYSKTTTVASLCLNIIISLYKQKDCN